MSQEMHDQTGVVTGGTRGIGEAVTIELARQGAKVIAIGGSNAEAAAAVGEALAAAGAGHHVDLADVRDREQVHAAVERGRQKLGTPVNFLICCAGSLTRTPLVDMTAADLDFMIDTHVKGTINAIQEVLPEMIERRYGRIITVTSPAATVGSNFGATAYGAAKGAIIGLTRSAAKELARHNITVNCISPAARTDMFDELMEHAPDSAFVEAYLARFPLGLPTAEEIAPTFAFLASPAASKITGQIIALDGGFVI